MRYLLVLLFGIVLLGLTACPKSEDGGGETPAVTDTPDDGTEGLLDDE